MSNQKNSRQLPIIEVFGSAFALLIVLFIIIHLITQTQTQERLANTSRTGAHKISWQNEGAGYVVITFPEKLLIVENATQVDQSEICQADSPFVSYAKNIYQSQKKQLIFAIVEKSVPTMRIARDCLMQLLPNQAISVAWMIANETLRKSIEINQIPAYIEKAIK